MSLTIELTPEMEAKLREESRRKGVEPADLAREAIEAALVDQDAKRQAARELLRQLREEGDPEEQRETFEALKAGLNESHSSYRKIFP